MIADHIRFHICLSLALPFFVAFPIFLNYFLSNVHIYFNNIVNINDTALSFRFTIHMYII